MEKIPKFDKALANDHDYLDAKLFLLTHLRNGVTRYGRGDLANEQIRLLRDATARDVDFYLGMKLEGPGGTEGYIRTPVLPGEPVDLNQIYIQPRDLQEILGPWRHRAAERWAFAAAKHSYENLLKADTTGERGRRVLNARLAAMEHAFGVRMMAVLPPRKRSAKRHD